MNKIMRHTSLKTGAKLAGALTLKDKLRIDLMPSPGLIAYPSADTWYQPGVCMEFTDGSSHNAPFIWPVVWAYKHGFVGRLGYGLMNDSSYPDMLQGFQRQDSAGKFKGLYHYMNTGVPASKQIDLIAEAIDPLYPDNIHFFAEDVELPYNEPASTAFTTFPWIILDGISSMFPKLVCSLYTGFYILKDNLGLPLKRLEKFPLWLGRYHSGSAPDTDDLIPQELIFAWQDKADGDNLGPVSGFASDDADQSRSRLAYELLKTSLRLDQVTTQEEPAPDPEPAPEFSTWKEEAAYNLDMAAHYIQEAQGCFEGSD